MKLTATSPRPQTAAFSKRIVDIDPENTSVPECEAALSAMLKHHSQYRLPKARQPKLWTAPAEDGSLILSIISTAPAMPFEPAKAYDIGRREGLFLGELLATIPIDERPLEGEQQKVASLKTLATAIRTMAEQRQWAFAMPRIENGVNASR